MVKSIVETLGFYGLLILLSIPVLIASVLALFKGVSFKTKSGHFILKGLLKHNESNSDGIIDTNFSYHMKAGENDEDLIGFEIPRPYVTIFGQFWNKSHMPVYRMLDDRWQDPSMNIVDITQANVTSSLNSLLASKVSKFGSLTIYLTEDQVGPTAILKQYSGVVFEVR